MPNRWIEFVKKWSSENNVSYGCALSKPEMKAEYSRLYPKVLKVKKKGVAKLEESRPPADVKSKVTYPNLSIKIPSPREEQDNIQFEIEEMDDQPSGSKRGRPAKYMTQEEKYKAKLENNKQKRREKAAAAKNAAAKETEEQRRGKAIQEFNTMRDRVLDVIDHMIQKYKGKLGNNMKQIDWETLNIYGQMYWLQKIRVKYNEPQLLRVHGISLEHSDAYKSDYWDKRINDFVTHKKLTKEMLDYFISKTKVEFPPPDSDIRPDLWIERNVSAKKVRGGGTCFGKQCGRPAAAAAAAAPPIDPLVSEITKLKDDPKNMIKDFIPNKVKREPQRDAQSRAGIQELTNQLNTRLQNENMFDYQSRRQKIYPQIVKLLKKIVIRTPAEQANLQISLDSGISGVFKSKYYNG